MTLNKAGEYYKDRGSGNQRIRGIKKAWDKNRQLLKSTTMSAIDRYNGVFYSNLHGNIKDKMRTGELNNVLIVSALFGMLKPRDKIPNYELMMKDKSPENDYVHRFWERAFSTRSFEDYFDTIAKSYSHIYCLMSYTTGYIPCVQQLLRNYDAYYFECKVGEQTKTLETWAQIMNTAIEKDVCSPKHLHDITINLGCKMLRVNDMI